MEPDGWLRQWDRFQMSASWGACSVLILKQGRFAIERVSTAFANLLRHWMHGFGCKPCCTSSQMIGDLFRNFQDWIKWKEYVPLLSLPSVSFISIRCNEADEDDEELEELENAGAEKEHQEPKLNVAPKSAAPKPVAAPVPKEAALRSHKITMLSRSQNFIHKLESLSHTSGLL